MAGAEGRRTIRLGTRTSRLAMAQTMLAAEALRAAEPELQVEIFPLMTKGDRRLDVSLAQFGGKGMFVAEFEEAILSGAIDAAVHSAKDMPMEFMEGLSVCAVLKREDPRDVFIKARGRETVREPFVIGTGSPRRQLQILERMEGVCKLLRGNVNTRLEKLLDGQYDGIILASAGLKRLGLLSDERFSFEFLPETEFIPAGGQGIIAVEGRRESEWEELFQKISDRKTEMSLLAERKVLKLLNAGCNEAVGVYSWEEKESFHMRLMREKNGRPAFASVSGRREQYEELAAALAAEPVSLEGV